MIEDAIKHEKNDKEINRDLKQQKRDEKKKAEWEAEQQAESTDDAEPSVTSEANNMCVRVVTPEDIGDEISTSALVVGGGSGTDDENVWTDHVSRDEGAGSPPGSATATRASHDTSDEGPTKTIAEIFKDFSPKNAEWQTVGGHAVPKNLEQHLLDVAKMLKDDLALSLENERKEQAIDLKKTRFEATRAQKKIVKEAKEAANRAAKQENENLRDTIKYLTAKSQQQSGGAPEVHQLVAENRALAKDKLQSENKAKTFKNEAKEWRRVCLSAFEVSKKCSVCLPQVKRNCTVQSDKLSTNPVKPSRPGSNTLEERQNKTPRFI
ncbi:unnamed protein product [Cylindrotheca closterium]|uniref:Uncharacterized protein n=1 Tax=Cylindrotheca closterium TaxID=2856 RepID=A0AAD2CCG8_9STRA|nr:unnamed protein product [Cylindrotheca closterium]